MKRTICIVLMLVLVAGMLLTAALGAQSLSALGWSSAGNDYTGWSVNGSTITGDYKSMKSTRIWKSCLTDMRNFILELDVSSDNTSSPYIKVLGAVLELDANNGDGNSVFLKVDGDFKEWINARGTKLHVKIWREAGGDLQIALTGDGYSNTVTYTATPVSASDSVEIGMYRGGTVTISNMKVTITGDGSDSGPAVDSNKLVDTVSPDVHFEFKGTGNWRDDSGWTSGENSDEGLWIQSSSADGANAKALYMTEKLSGNWYTSCVFKPVSTENNGRTVCRVEFVNASRGIIMLLTMEHLTDSNQVKFTWQTASGSGWTDVWKTDWADASDSAFTVRFDKQSDTKIKLTITGSRDYSASVTKTVSGDLVDAISRVAVSTERSAVRVTGFSLGNTPVERDYEVLAKETYDNLMKNYLNTANNRLYPVRWGFKNGDVTNTGRTVTVSGVGEVWESTVMMMAMDTYAQTLDKDSAEYLAVARIIANTVKMLTDGYTEYQLTTATKGPNYAMDDCGWNVMGLLLGYHYHGILGNETEAVKCLKYAKALFNSSYDTFYSTSLGGLAYTAAKADVSLYGATMALAGYYLNQIQPDSRIAKRYMDIYNGIEKILGRPDGLYWCGATVTGADGASNPYGIGEAGSVTYIGGNMAMAVLNSLLGKEDLATRTALGIARYETYSNGAFMNDRDAWNNTFFLGMYVREVLDKGICEAIGDRALEQTVSMILENSCFEDGYYSASWQGPREPESKGYPSIGDYSTEGRNNWGKGYNNDGLNIGSTPNQIMTSATTAHVLLAAALNAKLSEPDPEPTPVPTPDPEPDPTPGPTEGSEPESEPTVQPGTEPTTEPTIGPNTQPSTEPSIEPGTEPSAEPGTQPDTQPETQPEESSGTVPDKNSGEDPGPDDVDGSSPWAWIVFVILAVAGAGTAGFVWMKKKRKT